MMLPEALGTLREVMTTKKHPRREQAAEYIANQAVGTARQSMDINNPDGTLGAPVHLSVSFCTTPLSLGKAEVTHIGPDGKAVDVTPPLRDDQVEPSAPQLRRE